MLRGIWSESGEGMQAARAIRSEVFIREQQVAPELEWDGLDEKADHLVIFDGKEPVATGRMLKGKNGSYTFGRIAVRKGCRGQHIGEFLVKIMLNEAFERGGLQAAVHAQVQAQGFYEKLGFVPTGERDVEAGIEHVYMVKPLV